MRLDEFADSYAEKKKLKAEAEKEEKDNSEATDESEGEVVVPELKDKDDKDAEKDNVTDAIIDFFVAVANLNEYSTEQQKETFLKSEFITNLTEVAISKAMDYEQRGKWADSYTVCYYWLSTMYKQNKLYKDKVDELVNKITVQGSFIDSPCETAKDRSDGIELVMLHRTIKILTYTYISPLNFERMLHTGLDRCITIAEVLSFPNEDIAVEFDREQIQSFVAGVRKIKKEFTPGLLQQYYHTQVLDAFNQVLMLNEQTMKLSPSIIIMHFTEALLSELDPYTNIVWPFYVKEFQKSITQEFTGIGVEISKQADDLKVNSLLPDTPAFSSGLDAEDVILAVDGVSTEGMSINCAVSKISGPADTTVVLTVRHKDSDKEVDISIKRGVIVVPTIKGWKREEEKKWSYIIDDENKIGFLRLTSFTESTTQHMIDAIKSMKKEGLKGLILDLRYDSGGLLSTAVDVVNMFIEEGPIVSTKPRMGLPEKYYAKKDTLLPDCPLVILINGSSASASEIVSGALSDPKYKRAILVGERTYGKGSVQSVTAAPGLGAQLKYTMAFYYLPSDEPVKNRYQLEKAGREDWGIAPDVELEMYGSEIKKYFDIQRGNDILVKNGHVYDGQEQDNKKKHSTEDTISSDPQLELGLIVLKAKMLSEGLI